MNQQVPNPLLKILAIFPSKELSPITINQSSEFISVLKELGYNITSDIDEVKVLDLLEESGLVSLHKNSDNGILIKNNYNGK